MAPTASLNLNLVYAGEVSYQSLVHAYESSKERTQTYSSIARQLTKEARNLQHQADHFRMGVADEKKNK